jgi:hypothetical protein
MPNRLAAITALLVGDQMMPKLRALIDHEERYSVATINWPRPRPKAPQPETLTSSGSLVSAI